MARGRIGEDPEIVPKAFGNDVEVPAGFFELPVGLLRLPAVPVVRSGESHSQLAQFGFDRSKATIDRLKTAADRSETAIHRSLELGNSHQRAASADHSIVVTAKRMPIAERRKTVRNEPERRIHYGAVANSTITLRGVGGSFRTDSPRPAEQVVARLMTHARQAATPSR